MGTDLFRSPAKPSDLTDVKTAAFQVNTMVFTLPSVEVGSILEYRLQIRYDDGTVSSPTWEIQQPYFVHKAHYAFEPTKDLAYINNSRGDLANNLMYALIADNGTKMQHDVSNRYSLDVRDVPPFPKDDWMPPLNTIKWRAEFYYSPYISGAEFWQKEGKRWAKETDRFADPSKALKEAVTKIVNPGDTDEQKARKIYGEVMKLDITRFQREKSAAELKNENLKQILAMPMMYGRTKAAHPAILPFYMSPWPVLQDCASIRCRSSTATGQSSIKAISLSASSTTISRKRSS